MSTRQPRVGPGGTPRLHRTPYGDFTFDLSAPPPETDDIQELRAHLWILQRVVEVAMRTLMARGHSPQTLVRMMFEAAAPEAWFASVKRIPARREKQTAAARTARKDAVHRKQAALENRIAALRRRDPDLSATEIADRLREDDHPVSRNTVAAILRKQRKR